MPVQTQIACPNCRQPVRAAIDQLFDVSANPTDKQRFLAGQFNFIQCPTCGYQGQIASPLVYHDADKELLLSFFPVELSMPRPEQEKLVGRLVNQVIRNLPAEKRKGYLFKPGQALTLQGLVERVLEADGITREMLDAQRKQANLVQQLLRAPAETLAELIRGRDAEIDETFFQLFSLAANAGAATADPRTVERLEQVQQALLEHSTFGQDLKAQQADIEAAARALQAVGNKLTQEKFVELVATAPNEDQAMAMVGMVRGGVDYNFFQLLTRRVDRARGAEKERLTALREKILEFTKQVDEANAAHARAASEALNALLQAPDPAALLPRLLPQMDETFLAVLSANLQAAEQSGRKDVVERLNRIGELVMEVLAESAPPEVRFINELLSQPDDEAARQYIRGRAAELNQQYFDALTYVTADLRKNGQKETAERLEKLEEIVMREAMAARLRG